MTTTELSDLGEVRDLVGTAPEQPEPEPQPEPQPEPEAALVWQRVTAAEPSLSGVGGEVYRLTKLLHAVRARWAEEAPPAEQAERAAHGLLFPLVAGPRRPRSLADAVHSDPSTVSRHLALLLDRGLVAREPDPTDRRAHLVALTADGREVVRALARRRDAWFAGLLDGWEPDDLAALGRLLGRLNDAVAASLAGDGRGVPVVPAAAPTGGDPGARSSPPPRGEPPTTPTRTPTPQEQEETP